ncbi:MAG: lysine--tRNA ligase [Myxococcales bacterium]|nr:lysine--tRNA ligase [Myxococcales bacterium]
MSKAPEESSDLDGQIAFRTRKAEEIRERGGNPYANDFRVTHAIADVPRDVANLPNEPEIATDAPHYSVAGRLLQCNEKGKVAFLFLRGDRGEMIQLFVKIDYPAAFATLKDLQLGDIVGARGPMFKTRIGKAAMRTEELRLLTKAIRPLPGKLLGGQDVKDVESRYRQRYVDLISHPEVADVFRKRARLVSETRRFFDERGYVEVETRMLLQTNGGAAARPFTTHHNALDMDLFLRIATELDLKRLIVGGIDRVYEIGRIFRNEGMDRFHNPEFTSIEFYQAYATYEDLMVLTEQLFERLATVVCGSSEVVYQGQPVSLSAPFRRVTMRDAVRAALPDAPVDDPAGLCRHVTEKLHETLHADHAGTAMDYGHALTHLFEAHVESTLIQPTFIIEYPIEVSPLSRRNDRDPRFADRFELFIVGREFANAFSELNDPVDQRARFRSQVEAKAGGADETMDHDEDFCRALEHGMPPTAGEGIGIDRLAMLLTDQPSIRDVILFPQLRPEV